MLGQVGIDFCVAQVVDGDNLDIGAARFVQGAQNIAANSAIPIDRDINRHKAFSSLFSGV
jgi:hypothetical protein